MAAMQMSAMVHYQPSLFLLSVVIAIIVSLVALKLSIQFREEAWVGRRWLKFATACIMGGAVLSMHYTGMAAAMFKPDVSKLVQAAGLDNLASTSNQLRISGYQNQYPVFLHSQCRQSIGGWKHYPLSRASL